MKLYYFCAWARFVPGALDARSNLNAFSKRMMADPRVRTALEMQGLT